MVRLDQETCQQKVVSSPPMAKTRAKTAYFTIALLRMRSRNPRALPCGTCWSLQRGACSMVSSKSSRKLSESVSQWLHLCLVSNVGGSCNTTNLVVQQISPFEISDKPQQTDPTDPPPSAATAAPLSFNDDRGNKGGGETGYTSGQVAAIILPVLLVMLVIMVVTLAGMWLVLQRRKRWRNIGSPSRNETLEVCFSLLVSWSIYGIHILYVW